MNAILAADRIRRATVVARAAHRGGRPDRAVHPDRVDSGRVCVQAGGRSRRSCSSMAPGPIPPAGARSSGGCRRTTTGCLRPGTRFAASPATPPTSPATSPRRRDRSCSSASYGGAVIRTPPPATDVRALVYINGFVPGRRRGHPAPRGRRLPGAAASIEFKAVPLPSGRPTSTSTSRRASFHEDLRRRPVPDEGRCRARRHAAADRARRRPQARRSRPPG